MLQTLLKSIYDTAIDKYKVETIVTYDNDDQSTIDALPKLKELCRDFPVIFRSRERHYATSGVYYNEMAKLARGKYIIAVNDDTVFCKIGWDLEALAKIDDYLKDKPDGILYGITEDREKESRRNETNYFSCFPMISKTGVNALGFFFDPDFPKDGADWDIIMTYKEIGRILDLRNEIVIEHISFRSGRRDHDLLDADTIPIPNEHSASAGKNLERNSTILKEYIKRYGK
jgi:hypothetical protein